MLRNRLLFSQNDKTKAKLEQRYVGNLEQRTI